MSVAKSLAGKVPAPELNESETERIQDTYPTYLNIQTNNRVVVHIHEILGFLFLANLCISQKHIQGSPDYTL